MRPPAFLTLSYNVPTFTVLGYYNGTPLGSYSLASWGTNLPLVLVVLGFSGEGVAVTAGTATASNFFAGPLSGSTPPVVATTSLPNGTNGAPYHQTLAGRWGPATIQVDKQFRHFCRRD